MNVYTAGHGTRTSEELIELLRRANVQTLVDVRRYPGSRRNPQFNKGTLAEELAAAGIQYHHAEALGGRLSGEPGEPGEERFGCIRTAAFRSYAARMWTPEWQEALAAALEGPAPCFMCAETIWWRCHRKLIAELLVARGHDVLHLLPGRVERHLLSDDADVRDGRLYLCGQLVA
jgi:uncharacterized protein (DUF488 family)